MDPGYRPIPAYADGTDFHPGGVALVGEEGPELVNLPRGAQVFTANETRGMMSSPPGNSPSQPSKQPVVVQFMLDKRVLVQETFEDMREMMDFAEARRGRFF